MLQLKPTLPTADVLSMQRIKTEKNIDRSKETSHTFRVLVKDAVVGAGVWVGVPNRLPPTETECRHVQVLTLYLIMQISPQCLHEPTTREHCVTHTQRGLP